MASHENGIVTITKFNHVAPAFEGDVSTLLGGFDARTHFLVDAELTGTIGWRLWEAVATKWPRSLRTLACEMTVFATTPTTC
jgi:hypothetical protein